MKTQNKKQTQILAAVSCISLFVLAYLSIKEVSFGYFSLHLCAGFAFLGTFVPFIILEAFEARKAEALKAINEAINSGKVTNRKALNVVLDRASKIYSLDRNTFNSYDRLIKFI